MEEHKRKDHQGVENRNPIECKEPGCLLIFTKINDLINHLNKSHNLDFHVRTNTFDDENQFKTFMYNLKNDTKSDFTIFSSKPQCTYYRCSRSGSKPMKLTFPQKITESKKIESVCTAYMNVKRCSNNKLLVEYCQDHYGHEEELKFNRVPIEDKNYVAELIKQGVPDEIILDKIRNRNENSNPTRLYLANLQDIKNIRAEYSLGLVKAKEESVGLRNLLDESKKKIQLYSLKCKILHMKLWRKRILCLFIKVHL